MTLIHTASASSLTPESLPVFLVAVREIAAIGNYGGGIATVSDAQLTPLQSLAQLSPVDLRKLLKEFIGPDEVDIRRVAPVGKSDEVNVFVGPAEPFPLMLMDDRIPRPDGQGYFQQGDILTRRAGQVVRAGYEETVDLIVAATRKTYQPASARVLLDVALARQSRHPSAALDRMDLLWCLAQRESLDLTRQDLMFLLRNSLIRTPTLFFWLAEITDTGAVEQVLLSSVDDQDRDSSDSKDSILQVGALVASDACLREILNKMAASPYAHFKDAASEWQGRRVALNAFEQRVDSCRVDGYAATDLPLTALRSQAEQIARRAIQENGSTKALGDIGRVVFAMKTRRV